MNAKIENQLKAIDIKLEQLLNDLKPHSDQLLNSKPNGHSWSVLQVMHHLMLAEDLSAKYVYKKLSFKPELKNKSWLTGWRVFKLKTYNMLPIKLKAPRNVSRENLPDHTSLEETRQQWLAQRAQLKRYLETLPDELFEKEIYKHPLAGKLGLDGMLWFFEGHFDRHLVQINRTLQKLS